MKISNPYMRPTPLSLRRGELVRRLPSFTSLEDFTLGGRVPLTSLSCMENGGTLDNVWGRTQEYGAARSRRRSGHSRETAGVWWGLGEISGRPRALLQNTWKDEEKSVDKGQRRRSGLTLGLPIRQARRHYMAVQKKSSRMAKKERIPEDLTY